MNNTGVIKQSTNARSDKRILIIEDTLPLLTVYSLYLRNAGFEVIAVDTGTKGLEQLRNNLPSVVVLDLGLPDTTGIDILKQIRDQGLKTSVVVTTNNASLSTAVEAMRLGAFDYVVKPFTADRLTATVKNASEHQSLKAEVQIYRSQIARDGFQGFIGASLPMQAVYRIIESAATSKATVFICGESGTGKEVCASAIHSASSRATAPFVALNCAAIPRDLMESEIFGHVRGAFTGATADRVGAAAQANGGTLFLDEICEMSIELQSKLLRLIQNGSYQQVGSGKTETADIRFVCATNRNPAEEVRLGRFREDLFYRLHVIPIEIPPLRERGKDVLLIARSLLARFSQEEGRKFKGFSEVAEAALAAHTWPGNVRELQNVIRRAVVLNEGETLEADMLPLEAGFAAAPRFRPEAQTSVRSLFGGISETKSAGTVSSRIHPLWQVERDAIIHALAACEGNVTRAAAFLEVGVSTLYRKKAEYDGLRQIAS